MAEIGIPPVGACQIVVTVVATVDYVAVWLPIMPPFFALATSAVAIVVTALFFLFSFFFAVLFSLSAPDLPLVIIHLLQAGLMFLPGFPLLPLFSQQGVSGDCWHGAPLQLTAPAATAISRSWAAVRWRGCWGRMNTRRASTITVRAIIAQSRSWAAARWRGCWGRMSTRRASMITARAIITTKVRNTTPFTHCASCCLILLLNSQD